jgi:methylthioribulose-1-phosphate dehydratase
MSQLHFIDGQVVFSGYEVLKGLPGMDTHYAKVHVPIFANDQDMSRFGDLLITNKEKLTSAAFLMQKHGIYVWGENLAEAKRHLEIYEYLLDLELTLKAIK